MLGASASRRRSVAGLSSVSPNINYAQVVNNGASPPVNQNGNVQNGENEQRRFLLDIYLKQICPTVDMALSHTEVGRLVFDLLEFPEGHLEAFQQKDKRCLTIITKSELKQDIRLDGIPVRPHQIETSSVPVSAHDQKLTWVYIYDFAINKDPHSLLQILQHFGTITTELEKVTEINEGRLAGVWTGSYKVSMHINIVVVNIIVCNSFDTTGEEVAVIEVVVGKISQHIHC